MEIQLHVGKKADLSFNLRHFQPMKLFKRPRLQRKTDCHLKISGAIHAPKNILSGKNSYFPKERAQGNFAVKVGTCLKIHFIVYKPGKLGKATIKKIVFDQTKDNFFSIFEFISTFIKFEIFIKFESSYKICIKFIES